MLMEAIELNVRKIHWICKFLCEEMAPAKLNKAQLRKDTEKKPVVPLDINEEWL